MVSRCLCRVSLSVSHCLCLTVCVSLSDSHCSCSVGSLEAQQPFVMPEAVQDAAVSHQTATESVAQNAQLLMQLKNLDAGDDLSGACLTETHDADIFAVSCSLETYLLSGASIPKIIHQTAKSLNREMYVKECEEIYSASGWAHKFWTDAQIDAFVQENYVQYYSRWAAMTPTIRKVRNSILELLHVHRNLQSMRGQYIGTTRGDCACGSGTCTV